MKAAVANVETIARALVLREAALLDAEDYEAWLALLDERVFYWVPLEPTAADEHAAPSIYAEDKTLLEMRVRRFTHGRAFGREGGRRTLHQTTGIRAQREGDDIRVDSQLVVFEYFDGRLTLFPGRQTHRLRRRGDAWLILRKEVRLITMTGVFDPIEIIL